MGPTGETTHLEVRITCGSTGEAKRVADVLVGERLAACVHRSAISSVYEWQGSVEHDDEILLVAVTRADRFHALAARVTAMHSYDLPAITAVALSATDDYLAWVDERCGTEG